MEYTIYWEELMYELCNDIRDLLANEGLHSVFHQDLHYFLKLADEFTETIENVRTDSSQSIVLDEDDRLIHRSNSIAGHIANMTQIMMDFPMMYDNQQLAEPERSQVASIHAKANKLYWIVNNVKNYYKFLKKNPDSLLEYTDIDVQFIVKWSRTITVNVLDNPIHIFGIRFRVSQILLHLCSLWIPSSAKTDINVTISKDMETQTAKLLFEYPDLTITADELNNRLNPEYALQHNLLDLVLVKQLIHWQRGKFESEVKDQKVTFTVYLPLSKDADV